MINSHYLLQPKSGHYLWKIRTNGSITRSACCWMNENILITTSRHLELVLSSAFTQYKDPADSLTMCRLFLLYPCWLDKVSFSWSSPDLFFTSQSACAEEFLTIGVQQKKEPFAMYIDGWNVDPWLAVLLSHFVKLDSIQTWVES